MKIKKSELIALIKEEIMSEMYDDPRMDDAAEPMMENITDPAVQQVLIDVAAKLAPLISFVSLPVLIGALVEQIKKEGKGNRKKRGEM